MTSATGGQLEIVLLRAQHLQALAQLFFEVAADPTALHFHPHPFNLATAEAICEYAGKDLYFGLLHESAIAGYGMLRGWDEGYAIPSLGIYLSARLRNTGAASHLMQHMQLAAKLRGSKRIRLKVHTENIAARRLYEQLGYQFSESLAGQSVGYLALVPDES